MHHCDNCQHEFDGATEGLVATSRGRFASAVCEGCLSGATLIKLVLRRGALGGYTYQQYSAIEMAKAFKPDRVVG